jgi:hypothetical protein
VRPCYGFLRSMICCRCCVVYCVASCNATSSLASLPTQVLPSSVVPVGPFEACSAAQLELLELLSLEVSPPVVVLGLVLFRLLLQSHSSLLPRLSCLWWSEPGSGFWRVPLPACSPAWLSLCCCCCCPISCPPAALRLLQLRPPA